MRSIGVGRAVGGRVLAKAGSQVLMRLTLFLALATIALAASLAEDARSQYPLPPPPVQDPTRPTL